MQDGRYQVTMNSPMGEKKGVVEIQPETGCIVLNIMGGVNLFYGGFAPQYTFETTGTLKTALSDLPASLQGSVSGEHLTAVLHTEKGDFSMEGNLKHEGK